MTNSAFGLKALPVALAAVILGGCGAQSFTDSVPQGAMNAQARKASESWMKPGAAKGDLLYVSSVWTQDVYVYSYPGGSLVGTLKGFQNVTDLCSDSSGDVFVTDGTGEYSGSGWLLKYAHGGTTPIATLQESEFVPQDCAVDPTTGTVAVANHFNDFALFTDGSGSPTYYSTAGVTPFVRFVTYDSSGNAYFSGDYRRRAALFPNGGSTVMPFKIQDPPPKGIRDSGLGWDGTHLTDMSGCGNEMLQYKPNNDSSGKPVAKVLLNDTGSCFPNRYAFRPNGGATSHDLVVVAAGEDDILFYNYPQGGNPTKAMKGLGSRGYGSVLGVTISVAPSRK